MADNDFATAARVSRVLGVVVTGDHAAGADDFSGARSGCLDALQTINSQIAALQSASRTSRDDDLVEIAGFGFNGVTGNHSVRLTAVLMDIGIIAPFRQHNASDERIAVCDDNPFGVEVTIRSTMEPALAALQTALEKTVATQH